MKKARILAVDDEADILELLRYNLEREGYEVSCVANGEQALTEVKTSRPDLVVLDLMLPGIDGLEVCKLIKSDDSISIPSILMLTAKGSEADIVAGLELGADDYLVKPFSPRVLVARVRALLRRAKTSNSDKNGPLAIDNLVIDPARHLVKLDGEALDLTATEFKLLHFLASKSGLVYTRDQIVDAVHGEDYPVTDRSVDVQIVGLRKKLGAYGQVIETVRGVGYRFRDSYDS